MSKFTWEDTEGLEFSGQVPDADVLVQVDELEPGQEMRADGWIYDEKGERLKPWRKSSAQPANLSRPRRRR